MPVLGFQPVGLASIKSEDVFYIENRGGLYHRTYPVSFDQVEALLLRIARDKFKIGDYLQKKNNPRLLSHAYTSAPPTYFNIFRKQNCKRYALDCLEGIGLDVSDLRTFMEIPSLSKLDLARITSREERGQKLYYWQSPFKCRETPPKISRKGHQNQLITR